MKHFRKTIAATITAVAVAGVTMASAPAASAGVPIPEPDFRDPASTWTTYGLTRGAPFIGISLDDPRLDQAIHYVDDNAFGMACSALEGHSPDIADTLVAALRGVGQTCAEVVMDAIWQEQQWYAGQLSPPSWMRVVFYQNEYVTVLYYPSGYVTWYPW